MEEVAEETSHNMGLVEPIDILLGWSAFLKPPEEGEEDDGEPLGQAEPLLTDLKVNYAQFARNNLGRPNRTLHELFADTPKQHVVMSDVTGHAPSEKLPPMQKGGSVVCALILQSVMVRTTLLLRAHNFFVKQSLLVPALVETVKYSTRIVWMQGLRNCVIDVLNTQECQFSQRKGLAEAAVLRPRRFSEEAAEIGNNNLSGSRKRLKTIGKLVVTNAPAGVYLFCTWMLSPIMRLHCSPL